MIYSLFQFRNGNLIDGRETRSITSCSKEKHFHVPEDDTGPVANYSYQSISWVITGSLSGVLINDWPTSASHPVNC
jgi:hypothetical protein